MIFNMTSGGGGGGSAALNFKVVGSTTQPTSPSENTIWVNTDTEITSWIFSVTEPETPAEGMVWFSVGTASSVEFNALKKNGLQVYPLTARQYVSSAWVSKGVQIYQGGVWVDFWAGDLFKDGDQFEAVTGGWVQAYYQVYGSENNDAGTLTIGDTIEITANGGQCCKSARTNNKIDLTNYNTITVTGTCMYLLIATSTSGIPAALATENAKNLDISSFSGEYYVGVMARNYGSMSTETIKLS